MPHLLGPSQSRPFRLTLNSDGLSHPVENLLSIATLLCGLVAFVTGFIPQAHVIASWAGALGFGGGLYSQYVSATTAERAVNIVGIVASFVGVTQGIFHGGFVP
ncbi:hypothetical protein [Spongiactinospora sp. TRM90649]|uniref:hypothetical protein n=1 Tax=Spongiactinospora sp. TRM90649 TaxID=3031114 RepID=UPI0023F84F1B|nr:hypothetical protein [Spongiactinospora sp. TRM90649]MDF5756135.1 hypothetical protein [Spongiactinospora sp. TRM90649]